MKPVALNDFLQFKLPSSVTLSPDGTTIAYVLTSIKDGQYHKQLRLYRNHRVV